MLSDNHRIFLDTNFLLDITESRKEKSRDLLDKIKRFNWYCCTSSFTICELIDKKQEFTYALNLLNKEKCSIDEILRIRRQKDITQQEREKAIDEVRQLIQDNPIDIFSIKENGWNETLRIMKECKVSACDSIQIVTALENNCSVFITSDRQLGTEIDKNIKKLKWLSPEKAIVQL